MGFGNFLLKCGIFSGIGVGSGDFGEAGFGEHGGVNHENEYEGKMSIRAKKVNKRRFM